MLLLGKIDARRLKENPENRNNFHAHECEHCVMLMKFQWKERGTYEIKPGGVGGSYHASCAARCLETRCDETVHTSIQERSIEKSTKRIKYEEDVSEKTERFQEELGAATM